MESEVLVLGGGVKGLYAALEFQLKGKEVTVIDSNIEHEFVPGSIEIIRDRVDTDKLELNLKDFLKKTGIKFCLETVESIDHKNRKVSTDKGTHNYDNLVVALGSEMKDFSLNISDLKHVYDLSTVEEIRDKLDKADHVAVVGAGYVGVETMGEIAETNTDVTLISNRDVPMSYTNETVQNLILEYMDSKEVNFIRNKELESVSLNKIEFTDGDSINTDIVIWCRGKRTKSIVKNSFDIYDEGFEVLKDTEISLCFPVTDYDNLYASGDCANIESRINKNDSISLGNTAIVNLGNNSIKSKAFRYYKDIVRYKHFFHLRAKRFRIVMRNRLHIF